MLKFINKLQAHIKKAGAEYRYNKSNRTVIYTLLLVVSNFIFVSNAMALSFTTPTMFQLSNTSPRDVLVTDLDGDGNADMIFTMSGTRGGDSALDVNFGDGLGGLSSNATLPGGIYPPQGVTIADFNQDGVNDIATSFNTGIRGGVVIYLQGVAAPSLGNRIFFRAQIINISVASLNAIVSADFNADGFTDLAVSSADKGLYILDGFGDGSFSAASAVPAANSIPGTDLKLADFNNDKIADLVTPVSVFIGSKTGSFTRSAGLGGGKAVAIGDLNGDGITDTVSVGSTAIVTYIGNGDGTFRIVPVFFATNANIQDVVIADVNADGIEDVIISKQIANGVAVQGSVDFYLGPINMATGAWSNHLTFAAGVNPVPLALGDFNSDGLLDYVTGNDDPVAANATFSMQISSATQPGNIAPVASPLNLSTTATNPVAFTLSASDINGDALTYSYTLPLQGGVLTGTAPNLTYTAPVGYVGTDTFTYTAQDPSLATSNVATVSITVTSLNTAPVITSQNILVIKEDTSITLTTNVFNIFDPDSTTFTLNLLAPLPGANYTVFANTITPAVNFNGLLTVPVTVTDNTNKISAVFNASVTVTPVNDAPVITGQGVISTAEDSPLTIKVSDLNITDPDSSLFTLHLSTPGAGANYTVLGTTITPALNFNGTLTVSVTVTDNTNKISAVFNASVTVTPVNDAPVITGQSVISIAEDSPLTLKVSDLNITDPDSSLFALHLSTPGTGANYKVLGTTITPVLNFNGILTVPVTVTDNTNNSSVVFNASVTVTSVNDAPVVTGQKLISIVEGQALNLSLKNVTFTDVDTVTGFTLKVLPAAVNANYSVVGTTITPTALFNGVLSVPVQINDGLINSKTYTLTVKVIAVNTPPVINGQSVLSTAEDSSLTLKVSDFTITDPDSSLFTLQLSIPKVGANYTVQGSTLIPMANFNGTLVVPVLVNDGLSNSVVFNASVTITPVNDAPVSNAGVDQTTLVGNFVTLDGSGSTDIDGDTLIYYWWPLKFPVGATKTFSKFNGVTTNVNIDVPGTYTFRLYVYDGFEVSFSEVVVSTINSAPVANAGPDQTATVGDIITLNGSASNDVDGDPLGYYWLPVSIPAGQNVLFSNQVGVTTTANIDIAGTYTFRLFVNDGKLFSIDDMVVTTLNAAPVANPGIYPSVFVGDTVMLDASASTDVNGDPLSYSWSLTTVPMGSLSAISNSTAVNPSFVVDKSGNYVAQLIVNDGKVNSIPVTTTISTQNSTPVANPGVDQAVGIGNLVTLDGSASSDADFDPLIYRWSLTTPVGSTASLSDPFVISPTFTVDIKGDYVAQLIVNDGVVDSTPVTVLISTINTTPVADPGVNLSAFAGDLVSLDASASFDADNDALSYRWSLTTPLGSTARLSDPLAVFPTFTADLPGTFVAQLIVNDGAVDSLPVTVSISAIAPINANVFSLMWKGGDQQLIMTGDSDPATLDITYTSNGAPIMTINNSKGGPFETLANLSIAPCAITISTSTGVILLNNIAISGATANNCQ